MKVTRAQAEANHDRIIDVAGQLFREKGFDGIGLNDLMQAAGLTRGGFYGHFESKEDLAIQAARQAFESNLKTWTERTKGGDGLARLVRLYLSDRHRDHPGQGCAVAALGADAARGSESMHETFEAGVEAYLSVLMDMMPGPSPADRRQQALATYGMMIGALLVSRAVAGTPLSDEIREAVRRTVLG